MPPKVTRRNPSDVPRRGEWRTAQTGWQHGKPPTPPPGLSEASLAAWRTWFAAWFAGHWTPADVPALRQIIRLYDQVQRGQTRYAGELRMWEDTYGVTPKGQQDRRWQPPKPAEPQAPDAPKSGRYDHLRVVSEASE